MKALTRTMGAVLCLAVLLLIRPIPAAVISVDDDPGQDFRTITAGLDSAVSGDTVLVYEGLYDKAGGETIPLSIPSGVTLLGEDFGLAVIDASGGTGIKLDADTDVTIKFIKIINSKKSIEAVNGSDNLIIDYCYLQDASDRNINIKDCADPTITNNVVVQCKHGMILENATYAYIAHNTVVGIDSVSHVHGIKMNGSSGRIEYNIIERFGHGIEVDHILPDSQMIMFNNLHACDIPFENQWAGTTFVPIDYESYNTFEDPLFIDIDGGDFRLSEDSPCEGQGAWEGEVFVPSRVEAGKALVRRSAAHIRQLNGSITVEYTGMERVRVYSTKGRLLADMPARDKALIDCRLYPAGVYLLKLEGPGVPAFRKISLIK